MQIIKKLCIYSFFKNSFAYDFENGIRLYLTLGIPEEAATLARMSDDPQDAVKVALYYLEKGDLDEALMYLVRSECYHDALANAFKYGKTEYYVDFVFNHFKGEYPEGFSPGLAQVAADFESKKDHFRAGKCYQYLKQYGKVCNELMHNLTEICTIFFSVSPSTVSKERLIIASKLTKKKSWSP